MPQPASGGRFDAVSGYALQTVGRLRIDKASGIATIAAATSSVVVAPGLDVTAASFVLLTPRADLSARRLWYTIDAAANQFTIRVSSPVAANVTVGWLMLGQAGRCPSGGARAGEGGGQSSSARKMCAAAQPLQIAIAESRSPSGIGSLRSGYRQSTA